MIDTITFLNTSWIWQLCIGAFVLWAVFIWKEWDQYGKRSFWIKTVVSFLGITALAFIVLKPAVYIQNKTGKVALLTPGYSTKQLDSLKKTHRKLKVLTYNDNRPIFNHTNISDSVYILGHGLEPFDFWKLQNCNVNYLGGDIPSGIIKFKYDHKKTLGEQIHFSGLYNTPRKGHQLVLEGPGGVYLDSVSLIIDKKQVFQLSSKLVAKGNYLFSIIEKDTTGKIYSRDPIPLTVDHSVPLKILILNSFPTFETKYLKNYLSEMGHELFVKTKITNGKYKLEYFNMEKRSIDVFSKKDLDFFDLLVIDASTIRNLGKASLATIEYVVREQGLGVFVQPDDSFFGSGSGFEAFNFIREKSRETDLKEIPKVRISKHNFFFTDEFRIQSIHKNSNTQIISAYKRIRKGKIGSTVLENTYELVLNDKTEIYQQLWSDIINDISKKEAQLIRWVPPRILSFKDHPYKFTLKASITKPIVKTKENYRIAMRSDINISNVWKGITYPESYGWHTLRIEQDTTKVLNYFVTDTSTWKPKYIYDKIEENNRYFSRVSKKKTNQILESKPVNLIGLYILFLICMGYLWLIPKVNRD